jgi:hypothetical protein
MPHNAQGRDFDASIEEVLHLITHGYVNLYPDRFSHRSSDLTRAMDVARGGQFRSIPRRYPEGAWYTYDDETCEYECMAVEYFYWALTSILGGQDFP